MVTADEVPDPTRLGISCEVDGEVLQRASTGDMHRGVAELIAHCSRSLTREPGTLISTGTPGGVGMFREPQRLLRRGLEVTVAIDGLGRLTDTCSMRQGG